MDYANYVDSMGLQNPFSTGSTRIFICPYNEDDDIPRTSITTLNVHGTNNSASGSTLVSACRKFLTNGGINVGFVCGSPTTVSANGVYAASVNLAQWSSGPDDYGYIKIELPYLASLFGWYADF